MAEGGAAVEFFAEVDGERIDGTDAVVVDHLPTHQAVGLSAGYGGQLCRVEGLHQRCAYDSQDDKGGATQCRMAQEGAEAAVLVDQQPEHGEEKQPIAHVGEQNTVGVVGHGEDSAFEVVIVGRLVEAVALPPPDAVHRHHHRLRTTDTKPTLVVAWGVGAGIVLDAEVGERHFKRERVHLPPVVKEGARGFALAQMKHPARRGEGSGERPGENDEKSRVKQQRRRAPPQAFAHDEPRAGDSKRCPKEAKGEAVVDVCVGDGRTEAVLDKSGDDQDGHHHDDEEEGKFRKRGSFHSCGEQWRCTPFQ